MFPIRPGKSSLPADPAARLLTVAVRVISRPKLEDLGIAVNRAFVWKRIEAWYASSP